MKSKDAGSTAPNAEARKDSLSKKSKNNRTGWISRSDWLFLTAFIYVSFCTMCIRKKKVPQTGQREMLNYVCTGIRLADKT